MQTRSFLRSPEDDPIEDRLDVLDRMMRDLLSDVRTVAQDLADMAAEDRRLEGEL